ncbi:MAG: hypothetical protein GTO22_00995 [Gemmatimonadales bacterium]|nr:hypothetical protein [Gemmatimonadales bacterium]
MKKLLALAISVGAMLTLAATASADHAWNGYHWPDNNLSPTVNDKTSSSLFDIPAAVAEWTNLGTPIAPQMTSGNADVDVVVKRMNANWLGVARISVDSAGHIQAGRVELNRLYLNSLTFDEWDHVVCQELGHIWGLDHNHDGPSGGTPDDTCMNSSLHLGEYPAPNSHDAEQLNAIYGHADNLGGGDGGGGGGGGGCPPGNPNHPKCNASSGAWITVHVFRAR